LATGHPRGYLALPSLSGPAYRGLKRASVRLQVEPLGGKTVQDIVDGIVAGGLTNAVAESSGNYNIRVDLPIDQLAARTTDDKVVFDFVDVPTYREANKKNYTTNAVVKAVTWDPIIERKGLMLLFR